MEIIFLCFSSFYFVPHFIHTPPRLSIFSLYVCPFHSDVLKRNNNRQTGTLTVRLEYELKSRLEARPVIQSDFQILRHYELCHIRTCISPRMQIP